MDDLVPYEDRPCCDTSSNTCRQVEQHQQQQTQQQTHFHSQLIDSPSLLVQSLSLMLCCLIAAVLHELCEMMGCCE
jgi:hypothetical protein